MAETIDKKSNIYLFFGEDTYSSNEKLKFWKEQFLKKYGENSNIEVFDGKTLDISKFDTNIETFPFLSEKRLIIIKDFLSKASIEDQKKVAKSLEKTPDFCIIVFHESLNIEKNKTLYKKIKDLGQIEEFKHLSPLELNRWILKQAREKDIKINEKTANHLSQHCGTELWRISNELEKLKLYANNKEITIDIIDKLVTPSLTSSIFKLTDAIAEKRPDESLKILSILKDSGEELTKIFFMIVRHFRILIQVHEMAEKKETQSNITKKLKQHPFVIQKTLNQSRNFRAEKLLSIYQNLLQIDRDFKTGKIKTYKGDDREYKLAIEKFIINCCK